MSVPKTQADRITECMTILKRLSEEVGIDAQNPSIRVLKKRMAQYWRDGKLYEEKLPLWGYDRSIIYKFPRWSHQEVEVTLRVNKVKNPQIPADLQEELASTQATNQQPTNQQPLSDPAAEALRGTSSATQSGPLHPSLPE